MKPHITYYNRNGSSYEGIVDAQYAETIEGPPQTVTLGGRRFDRSEMVTVCARFRNEGPVAQAGDDGTVMIVGMVGVPTVRVESVRYTKKYAKAIFVYERLSGRSTAAAQADES